MHHCINCGRRAATRQGDTFTCERCHFEWDVAFEQANAAYLRTQGRTPAQPWAEEQAAAAAVPPDVAALQDLATPVKFDGALEVGEPLGEPLPEFDSTVEREADPAYEALTVDELKTLAAERGIDLTGHTRKAEIIAALQKADALAVEPSEE